MRALLLLFLLVSFVVFVSAKYEGHQVWRMKPTTERQMTWLNYIEENMDEFDFWTSVSRIPGRHVDIMVQPNSQINLRMLLKQEELDFEIMIDDVSTLVANQMDEIRTRRESEHSFGIRSTSFDYNNYHEYEEIKQWVLDTANENSDIITAFLLGTSYEGRDIYGLRIRGTGSQNPYPKAVWFEGGIHAREWISPATVMGFTHKLIEEYRLGESVARMMFDNIDWYIVPSLNADGYVYTWTTDRMWRKTRSPNTGSVCVGTDPNRNWPFEWGGIGASDVPCSQTYMGSSAGSEIEVENVVKYLRERKAEGQDFLAFIDFHSYSQLIIAPWGYLEENYYTDDYDDQMAMADEMATAIKETHRKTYDHGVGAEILYSTSGSSKDFGYAPFTTDATNSGIGAKYSYTIELRDTGRYGFALPANQIQPSYEEIHAAVRAMGTRLLTELGL
ncbi:carboxypeptidase B-like [Lytechinus pictus]|uniref:carboxypeptidase B-like n=1 Tax=Lytechinus pictus TaxID=7653 RepID=UPI0030BA1E4D